jgi:toxin YoeB
VKLAFTESAWPDYLWFQSRQQKLLKRINTLIGEILRHPFTGTGKPEPLKGELSGYWSRRINAEHRLVYSVEDDTALIISCRFHYHK